MPGSTRRISRLLAGAFLLLGTIAPTWGTELLLVHGQTPVTGLSLQDLQDIYLGRKRNWTDGGTRVVLSTLEEGPVSDALMGKVGRSYKQFVTFWRKQVFTGLGSEPSRFSQEEELVAFVAATPGAIGYVDAGRWQTGGDSTGKQVLPQGVKAVQVEGCARNDSLRRPFPEVNILGALARWVFWPVRPALRQPSGPAGERS